MNRVHAVIAGVVGLWFLLLSAPRSAGESVVAFAFAAILLLFAYRRFRAPAKKTAEYLRQEDGTGLRLTVSPAAQPVLWFPLILAVGFGAGIVGSGVPYLWVLGLMFAGSTWLVLLKDHRGGNATATRSFRVNSDGIELDGVLLRQEDIHHLRIKNKFAGEIEIVYDANRGLPTGTVMGLAGRRALAELAYRVEVEAGGKVHVLAAGLDEATARAIAIEIGKMLKLSVPAS